MAHGLFLIAVAGAVWLRAVTMEGFPSPFWFSDSLAYMAGANRPEPSLVRPSGYSLFLWALRPWHSFTVVLSVQHALAIGMAAMVYALVWRAGRAGRPRWIWLPGIPATLVTLPVLYDGYQIQLEHQLLADLLFTFLLVAAVTVALWRSRLTWWAGALAGLLLAGAALTRSVGVPLLLVLVVCLAVRRVGWRGITALAVCCVAPVLGYMTWFDAVHGRFALTATDQIFLYGRTVAFADCAKIKPPPDVAVLCQRPRPPNSPTAPSAAALWSDNTPLHIGPDWFGNEYVNKLAGEFAWSAIKAQPGDYARIVLRDTFRAFAPGRDPYPTPNVVDQYKFPQGADLSDVEAWEAYDYGGDTAVPRVVEPAAGRMRDYQSRWYLPGPGFGAIMAVGLLGALARWRRWGGPGTLPWLVSLALLVIPAATADFDYRYSLPAVPLAGLAAGLALTERRRAPVPAPAALEAAEEPADKEDKVLVSAGSGEEADEPVDDDRPAEPGLGE